MFAAALVARVHRVAARQPKPEPSPTVRAGDLRDGHLIAFCGHTFLVRHVAHYGDRVCAVLFDGEGTVTVSYHPDEILTLVPRPPGWEDR